MVVYKMKLHIAMQVEMKAIVLQVELYGHWQHQNVMSIIAMFIILICMPWILMHIHPLRCPGRRQPGTEHRTGPLGRPARIPLPPTQGRSCRLVGGGLLLGILDLLLCGRREAALRPPRQEVLGGLVRVLGGGAREIDDELGGIFLLALQT